jgi:two-component system nitrate/nitrite response regulator NarL
MSKRPSFATIIVGKSSLLREGIAKILRSASFRIVASVSSADDLPGKVQADRPLFLIVQTGDDFEFVTGQIGFFRENYPNGRIAIVADRYRPDELVSAFRVGANGCFVDVMTCDVFIRSLELVMMGETVLPPNFLSYVFGPEEVQLSDDGPGEDENETILVRESDDPVPQLSPRETLILRCLIEGGSNKSIARKMDIAEATVKVHVKAILRKIRVHNRTQAAIWGMNNGCLAGLKSAIAPPPLSPGMGKRLPNAMRPDSQIEQISQPVCSTLIDQTNHAELPRIERLIHKDASFRAEVASRPRK